MRDFLRKITLILKIQPSLFLNITMLMKMVKSVFHGTGSESLTWMEDIFVFILPFFSQECPKWKLLHTIIINMLFSRQAITREFVIQSIKFPLTDRSLYSHLLSS